MVKGFRDGSDLLYLLVEKCLYRSKRKRNGGRDYICYQTILSKPTTKKPARIEDRQNCNATVRLYSDGTCRRINETHSAHKNHERIMRDMEKANNMKEKCHSLKKQFSEDSHKISARNIYQREVSRFVCLLICLSTRPSVRPLS